ncbi:MAG: hypothetical protein BA861_11740 [Desulfobacterales bacterium S3730MH5]|nr:MAG: hypothetical protein BA861_11740 [Desulfobacterales bacterium S3730MH5]OEU78883.1 MAG: hypothetical protein BA873_14255 [Desulfobulbaceae bacterium C00003063]OEU84726.1 MAG: hypothetical protein BA865_01025 [Desulfobacterales bacterium S5133MH4]
MKKILVVDNDRLMLEFMNDILSEEGHQIVTAEDGLSALDILETHTPDVIFVDLIMPNIDGKKLCATIRGMQKLKDTYLVILTAIAVVEDIDIAEFRANACVAKGPFSAMAQHILAVLNQSDPASSRSSSGKVIGLESDYPPVQAMNLEKAIKEFMGDAGFLFEVLKEFLENVRGQIATIGQAISRGDAEVVRNEAHSIKGGAANLTANELSKIAFELENIGKSGNLEGGIQVLQKLETEFHRLEAYARDKYNENSRC